MLFRSEKLRADDFSQTDGGCLLGKAGRARFYAEWEPMAGRLRKLLTESVSDVAAEIVHAGAVDAQPARPGGVDSARQQLEAEGRNTPVEVVDDRYAE